MCLTVPGRIVLIEERGTEGRSAEVDFGALHRRASLLYVPEAAVGDFVLVQAGFAVRRLTVTEAEESLAYHRELSALSAEPARSTTQGNAARDPATPPHAGDR